jgi:putative nucleotidyltransferase with HDIG domain
MHNLNQYIARISDVSLREKTRTLLTDTTFVLGDTEYIGLSLHKAPASRYWHHGYVGGLLQHTIAAAEIALTLCRNVKEIYLGQVDEDVVLASILLHDLFKIHVYAINGSSYRFSQLGTRLDHLTLLVSELTRRDFPLDVIHAVAAHHGQNGPISPHSLEALICYVADNADASFNGQLLKAAQRLANPNERKKGPPLTSTQALQIIKAAQNDTMNGRKTPRDQDEDSNNSGDPR